MFNEGSLADDTINEIISRLNHVLICPIIIESPNFWYDFIDMIFFSVLLCVCICVKLCGLCLVVLVLIRWVNNADVLTTKTVCFFFYFHPINHQSPYTILSHQMKKKKSHWLVTSQLKYINQKHQPHTK